MERSVESRAVGGKEPSEVLAQLKEQHARLESRLAELEGHVALTSEEQVERARIKKLKLATKDQMLALTASLSRR
ncbi:MAG TPA: YdcH family protein [Polyangia bacterium]|jgi:hypothetical protein